jgi:hypothetical protein
MDDFAKHVDQRFDAVERRFETVERRMDDGFKEMNARFDAMQRTLIQVGWALAASIFGVMVALVGVIATKF